MSKYDEPNHLSPESTPIESSEREYTDEEMKDFQHGKASPFMPAKLVLEIQEENRRDREYALQVNRKELNRFFKGWFKND